METFEFRPAVAADAAACVELRGRTRENAFSAARLAERGITAQTWGRSVEAGKLPGRVCTVGGEIVGYCFGDSGSGEIVVLAVLPAYEGRGIGRALLSEVTVLLRQCGHARLFLGCSRNPGHRSYGFYRHLGWMPTGLVDDHDDDVLEYRGTIARAWLA